MKKIIAFALIVLMIFAVTLSAFAISDNNGNGNGNTGNGQLTNNGNNGNGNGNNGNGNGNLGKGQETNNGNNGGSNNGNDNGNNGGTNNGNGGANNGGTNNGGTNNGNGGTNNGGTNNGNGGTNNGGTNNGNGNNNGGTNNGGTNNGGTNNGGTNNGNGNSNGGTNNGGTNNGNGNSNGGTNNGGNSNGGTNNGNNNNGGTNNNSNSNGGGNAGGGAGAGGNEANQNPGNISPIAPMGIAPATSPIWFPLHQADKAPINWLSYRQGESSGLSASKGETALVPGYSQYGENGVFWHFVNPDKLGGYAYIYFIDENGTEQVIGPVYSYKNGQHFGVVTPDGWKLMGAKYYPATQPSKGTTLFNLSHTSGKITEKDGALKVTVNAVKKYDKVTYQPFYYNQVQPYHYEESQFYFYEESQPYFKYDIQQYYYYKIQPFFYNIIQPYFRNKIQPYHREIFERYYTQGGNDTLVSWIDGGKLGTAWGNGHTYVNVNVAAASAEGGIWFDIADSSPSNKKVGYQYNVKIADGKLTDGKLTVSFGDDLRTANVGAYVVNNPSQFPGNAPSHVGKSVTVNLPAGYGDVVYLYMHLEGVFSWYQNSGQYILVGTQACHNTKEQVDCDHDPLVTETPCIHDFYKEKTNCHLEKDEIDCGCEATVTERYCDHKTVTYKVCGHKTVTKIDCPCQPKETWERGLTTAYEGQLTLVVTGPEGEIYKDVVSNGFEKTWNNLKAGTVYTFVLYDGKGNELDKQTATVAAGNTKTVPLKGIVNGKLVKVTLNPIQCTSCKENILSSEKCNECVDVTLKAEHCKECDDETLNAIHCIKCQDNHLDAKQCEEHKDLLLGAIHCEDGCIDEIKPAVQCPYCDDIILDSEVCPEHGPIYRDVPQK